MISGRTQNLGVIGYPIAHSLSPLMQNAALRQASLDYRYIAMPVLPENLRQAVLGLKSLSFRGFNVTIPHKTAIMPLLDEIQSDAEKIGAVNTVVNQKGRLIGYNTDVTGFLAAMKAERISLQGKAIVILGAGGAARAVLWGMLKERAGKIMIGGRDVKKTAALLRDFSSDGDIEAAAWEDTLLRERLQTADLIVNTTPLGMYPKTEEMVPIDWAVINPRAFLYDVIYTPQKTRFLREGEARGHRIANGVSMLVEQGAAAYFLWTGATADRQAMLQALQSALI